MNPFNYAARQSPSAIKDKLVNDDQSKPVQNTQREKAAVQRLRNILARL